MKATVKTISKMSEGVNPRTQKPWIKYRADVETDQGELKALFLFDDLTVGKTYEFEQVTSKDGKYTNWRLKKDNPQSQAIEQLNAAIGFMNDKLDELLKRTDHMSSAASRTTTVKADLPF